MGLPVLLDEQCMTSWLLRAIFSGIVLLVMMLFLSFIARSGSRE